MEVRACRAAGTAGQPEHLAAPDRLPRPDQHCAEVGVQRLKAVAVVDDDMVAVSVRVPADEHDVACIGSPDGIAGARADVNGAVAGPELLGDVARDRPLPLS